ncbi:uncharacterized protein PAC_06578 [Phialocephala subalpina]|uniref:MARVEL domain-containing protein n=1 Tax=Phialocephala subalpina TaxID=576137 RepID=A0A1L7WV96_9HELO|nr:uncharacterized protein PAC_06578 [Phialocephala subalpina]
MSDAKMMPEGPAVGVAEVAATSSPAAATTKPVHQTNKYLWGLRFIQIIFAIVIVGITGSSISDWHNLGCSTPSGLAFNFAIGLLSLLLVLYWILSTGPYAKIPWYSFYAVLGCEIVFIIFWIVAAAVQNYSCDSICNVCSAAGAAYDDGEGFIVWMNDIICSCVFPGDLNSQFSVRGDDPSVLFKRGGRPITSDEASRLGKTASKGVTKATKQGLDAAMMLFFITSLITLVSLRYKSKEGKNVVHDAEQVDQHVENPFKMETPAPA